ncbi:5'-methylthioadenosine/S-adenosylhomocysteine nucleosidase [Sporolactobacillus sp. THM19-2]|jgi:adenosylhomocysteine nucleosidase|uniref:5'-methylthioadenosine/S-adenosylhomocysteine nucleosidase n=1 Tax=Sporolactobacillus sp. THM19-2 TaxID=2511171 RepID=UPI0010225F81|nr:5'-methylthioadenosine/S-adenosylhomocysteine nucleosidase [Sporolactobacillus sp. THM19-2]RYL94745.1 5'-methylthioadenosine/S-adenosylhomocysteine nucleosidase [Sporolactobacillus sp. THM19-2]
MRLGLIGAMEEEIHILKSKMDQPKETEIAHSRFFSGKLAGIETVLLQSGIGKVNASIGTTLLIDHFHPDAVINTGSAGGTDAALDIGDVVISSRVIHHDADATAFGYQYGQIPGMPPAFIPDGHLSEMATDAAQKVITGHRTVHGVIGSGDSFMSDSDRIDALKHLLPELKAVEMEAAAIAQVCYQFGVPFLIVRALSDIAGKQSEISFDQFLEKAAKNSAEFVLALLKEMETHG